MSGLKQWLCWSEEKIQKFGDFAPGVKQDKSNKTDDAKATPENTTEATKDNAETQKTTAEVGSNPNVMPVPKAMQKNLVKKIELTYFIADLS